MKIQVLVFMSEIKFHFKLRKICFFYALFTIITLDKSSNRLHRNLNILAKLRHIQTFPLFQEKIFCTCSD